MSKQPNACIRDLERADGNQWFFECRNDFQKTMNILQVVSGLGSWSQVSSLESQDSGLGNLEFLHKWLYLRVGCHSAWTYRWGTGSVRLMCSTTWCLWSMFPFPIKCMWSEIFHLDLDYVWPGYSSPNVYKCFSGAQIQFCTMFLLFFFCQFSGSWSTTQPAPRIRLN